MNAHFAFCDIRVEHGPHPHGVGLHCPGVLATASTSPTGEPPLLRWTHTGPYAGKPGPARLEPRKAYSDDAGLDLVVEHDTMVKPGEFVDIECGVAVELPAGVWGMLTGRSSTLRKKGLLVNTAVIDPGYRGPLFAGVWSTRREARVVVKAGERIAQLIPISVVPVKVEWVPELSDSPRGSNGFGSTGE